MVKEEKRMVKEVLMSMWIRIHLLSFKPCFETLS